MDKKITVLRSGTTDALNILDENLMDNIVGGDMQCKKDYSISDNKIICGCGYSIDRFPTDPGDKKS